MKFLKWLGLVALVTVPIAVLLKKKEEVEEQREDENDDSEDIFAAELRE